MRKRLIQILGFLASSLGWVFVLCTIAMDYWRITQLGGQGGSFIIRVAWYWSNLWKDCFTDSTAVTNCRDFPVLWTVTRKYSIYCTYLSKSMRGSRKGNSGRTMQITGFPCRGTVDQLYRVWPCSLHVFHGI